MKKTTKVETKKPKFTMNQLKVRRELLKKVGITKAQAIRNAGLAKTFVINPSRIITPELEKSVMDELEKVLPINIGHEAVIESAKKESIRKERFDEDIEDEDIREIFKMAGKKLLKILVKENSKSTATNPSFTKIAYYIDGNYDSKLRAADLIYQAHGLIGKKKEDEKPSVNVYNTIVDLRRFVAMEGIKLPKKIKPEADSGLVFEPEDIKDE